LKQILTLGHTRFTVFCELYNSFVVGVFTFLNQKVVRRYEIENTRALSLPVDASCDILPGLAGTLPVFDEIVIRSASFIQKCLSSDSHIVRSVANMAVFSLRMRSPLGHNAFVCCSRYDLTLSNIFMLSRERVIRCIARRMGVDVGARLSLVRELLLIRSGILSFSDLVFSNIDVDLMINSLSRSA
jgi:hypothetical protein